MVRVLANGEVVSDDEYRSQNSREHRSHDSAPRHQQQEVRGQGPTDGFSHYWTAINEQLQSFGINNFQVAGYTVEPAHILLTALALIFMGPLGIILILILITATQERAVTAPTSNAGSAARPANNPFSQPPSAYRGTSNSSDMMTNKKSDSKVFGGPGQRLGYPRRVTSILPSCSYVLAGNQNHHHFSPITNTKRNISQLPSALAPFFQYASECNITQGIETGMQALHGLGLPWATTFIASGIALRLLTAPFHVYSEKLLASRMHAQSALTHGLLKKVGEQYKVEVTQNPKTNQLELKTENAKITSIANKALSEHVPMLLSQHNLQASRIQNLKICTVPVWIFSSFALRNVISADFHPNIAGAFWVPDLLVPDPYFIIPVAVGAFGFLNIWSQRRIYPVVGSNLRTKTYDFLLASFTLFAVVIMSNLPAVIPMYWLVVSTTGMLQSQMLRHPTIKKLVGIKPMPTDSKTPFRDLFLRKSKFVR